MDSVMNETKVHPYSRGVSIIGVGCTPFMYTVDNPETNGLTEGEMFGYAALQAMEDAGVNPQKVDFYFHGEASPLNGSNYLTPNIQVANWFGMKGKASIHHSEACCTGYYAVEEAVNAVASGKYNCVLSGCVEFGDSLAVPGHPYKREKMTMDKFLKTTSWLYDRNYTRSLMAGQELIYDDAAEWYKRTRGLTDQQMDDTLNRMCINNRRNASVNPLALERRTYEDIAKEKGFDNVMDYMRSPYNPQMGDFLRASGVELKCDGAAAVIVCATELVDRYMGNKNHKAVEVLGTGCAACEATTPHFEVSATKEAVRQVYEVTGVKPEEIDIFYANDFIITSHLISAEIAGYLPYGEGWKYICEGRTAYDGDKPINTNGGRTSFGHAHAASGLADLYEAVRQMRGEAGAGQVKFLPKTAMLRGYGGAQNICTYIIRTAE
ncbi:MAG TPA: thiolase family protein [Lachnospiraceae bacterium]|nr:thiolase family protein [Lachnospiraceae bacterium]